MIHTNTHTHTHTHPHTHTHAHTHTHRQATRTCVFTVGEGKDQKNETVQCDFVVGADGAFSKVAPPPIHMKT